LNDGQARLPIGDLRVRLGRIATTAEQTEEQRDAQPAYG
jgi:hypothetical protein